MQKYPADIVWIEANASLILWFFNSDGTDPDVKAALSTDIILNSKTATHLKGF